MPQFFGVNALSQSILRIHGNRNCDDTDDYVISSWYWYVVCASRSARICRMTQTHKFHVLQVLYTRLDIAIVSYSDVSLIVDLVWNQTGYETGYETDS